MRAVTPETDASAHGVTYVEMIKGLGRTHFACAKINASALSIDTCAGRWKQAKASGEAVQFMACKGCPIGRCAPARRSSTSWAARSRRWASLRRCASGKRPVEAHA